MKKKQKKLGMKDNSVVGVGLADDRTTVSVLGRKYKEKSDEN